MIPIPLYPMFSAVITMNGGSVTPYYMDENNGWQIDIEEMEREIKISKNEGKNVKALVIISPGNPTGAILSEETIRNVIIFAVKNKLPIITDHVSIKIFRYIVIIYTKRARNLYLFEEFWRP